MHSLSLRPRLCLQEKQERLVRPGTGETIWLMSGMLTVRLCQFAVQDGASESGRAANFSHILETLSRSTEDLVIFPEACTSGFPYRRLADVARANQDFIHQIQYPGLCVLPLLLAEGARFVNRTVVLSAGRPIAAYTKIHLIGLLGEDRFLIPGSDVTRFTCGDFTAGLATCYDLRFPELFRSLMQLGSSLFIVPAMWPVERAGHLHALARARAIENQAYVIVVNAAGKTGSLDLCGQSAVFDPQGNTMVQAAESPIELTAALNLEPVSSWRAAFPVLKDAKLLKKTS